MVRIEEKKELTEDKPIQKAGLPSKVYIPLIQHTGKECSFVVKRGEEVRVAQMIATSDSGVFSPIHSSVSGKVVDIADWSHPVLGRKKAIIVESTGEDRVEITNYRPKKDIEKLGAQEIRRFIFEAGVVGLGGAGFPAHIKLAPPKSVDSFILNGCECEPYLTCDFRLMLEKTKEILLGVELVLKCLGARDTYIAIEENKPEAIKAFEREIQNSKFKIQILKSHYPQGGEKQLIKNILKREVPSGGFPFDVGVVVHNVGTVFSIYEAVYLNKPLYERVVTVTGSCLENPKNLLVRIGTPIKDLIEECGFLKEEAAKIIVGGPMMGVSQYTLDIPVIKSTTGVIFFTKEEIEETREEFCIRCGECIVSCPIRIYPNLISLAVENKRWDKASDYGAKDCIECGLCSYICPAKRSLVGVIKKAKIMIG